MAKTLTSRQFNQDTGAAKRLARKGPVVITDRGRPAHVLLTFEHYQRLRGGEASIVDLLSMPGADFEFEPARADSLRGSVDLV